MNTELPFIHVSEVLVTLKLHIAPRPK